MTELTLTKPRAREQHPCFTAKQLALLLPLPLTLTLQTVSRPEETFS